MKKTIYTFMACILIITLAFQTQVQAAGTIGIYINGNKLSTDQAPVVVSGRALLPLRAIFEALNAQVNWNPNTKIVTATKDDKTIVLKLGAKTATINNSTVALDVPVQSIKGRTLVPVRFVSEALGEKVDWNSSTQRVTITTETKVNPVSYVNAKVIGQVGDGRDLQVSFPKAVVESGVNQYRIMVVKTAKVSSFNLAVALSNNNYTPVPVQGNDVTVTLSSQARDVNGDLIQANQPYVVYVLTVAKGEIPSALSGASSSVTITTRTPLAAISNLTVSDVNDYNDGRDLLVGFNRVSDESNISHYRVMVVRSENAGSFNLATANGVSSANYTNVTKTGSNISQTLSSSAKDVNGATIRNDVNYRIFVLSVGKGSYEGSNTLSSYSSAITLTTNNNVSAITNLTVSDVSDYNDGRDLLVGFKRISDESNIGHYRVMVVRSENAGKFNLATANAVSSSNYTYVAKTGSNITQTLSSSTKDVNGAIIKKDVNYRIFVLSVGKGSYEGRNALSTYSSEIKLTNNYNVNAVTNLTVRDVSDYNDGRDLLVEFKRVSDESNIGHYRVMVVKSENAGSFNLATANGVSSANYTYVTKTGSNISQILSSSAKDVNGTTIKKDVNYRVFVLSVGKGSSEGNNALSSYSSPITLTSNYKVNAVTNLNVSDVSDYNDGRDLLVSFNRIDDESTISQYRVMAVKAENSSKFNLDMANKLSSSNYIVVSKTGANISQTLSSTSRDVDGATIKKDVNYRIFILSVGKGNYEGSNALSSYSSPITLTSNYNVSAVTNLNVSDVSDYNDGRDLLVSFNRVNDENTVSQYRVMAVKAENSSKFNLDMANALSSSKYTVISKTGANISETLSSTSRDVDGVTIKEGVNYRIFVLTVGRGSSEGSNGLSSYSSPITLTNNYNVSAVTNISVSDVSDHNDGRDLLVSFNRVDDETKVSQYRIMAVKSDNAAKFNLDMANALSSSNYTVVNKTGANLSQTLSSSSRDVDGATIKKGVNYRIFVLTVGKGSSEGSNGLSSSSDFALSSIDPVPGARNLSVTLLGNAGDSSDIQLGFNQSPSENEITEYRIMIVRSSDSKGFDISKANSVSAGNYIPVAKQGGNVTLVLPSAAKDVDGATVKQGYGYRVFVLAVANGGVYSNSLSEPSDIVEVSVK